MTKDQHFTALENMYLAAPISELYHPSIEISDSEGNQIGRGSGVFMRSTHLLSEARGYATGDAP